ncbi:MAG: membrane associated rhomboid family serine protease [Patiriisocius sp.]|jgi:membrane associated rhomboid family serine protease
MPSLPKGCPITLSLMAANILFFAAQFATQDMLTTMGLLYGPFVQDGQYWRIISSGFLHGSILHIAFNMYLLYMLGPQLEQTLGSLRFSLMYFGSLIGGSLAVLTFGFMQPTLGASGAVLGLAGAMFITLWGRGVSPTKSPVFGLVVLNLGLPLLIPGISFWGHFGGVVGGSVLAFVMVWLPEKSRIRSGRKNISQGTAIVFLMTAACFAIVQIA